MHKDETLKQIREIYSLKTKSIDNFNRAYKLLARIRDSEPFAYNMYMGEFLLLQNRTSEAEKHLLMAKTLSDTSSRVYYDLYKLYICENEYLKAHKNLVAFGQLKQSDEVALSLPLTLINASIDIDTNFDLFLNSEYKASKTPFFEVNANVNEKILVLYDRLVLEFNNKDYNSMLKTLKLLNKHVKECHFDMEFKTIKRILMSIINKQKKAYTTKFDTLNYENVDDVKTVIKNAIKFDLIAKEDVFFALSKLLVYDVDAVKEIFSSIKMFSGIEEYDIEKNCLENMIKEKELYLSFSKEKKQFLNSCIEKGAEENKNKNFEKAITHYEEGKLATEYPIFDYYIGKMYYKSGNIEEAIKYLKAYEQKGGYKIIEALLYLHNLNKLLGNKKVRLKITKKLNRLIKSFSRNVDIAEKERDDIDYIKNNSLKQMFIKDKKVTEEELTVREVFNYTSENQEDNTSKNPQDREHKKSKILYTTNGKKIYCTFNKKSPN